MSEALPFVILSKKLGNCGQVIALEVETEDCADGWRVHMKWDGCVNMRKQDDEHDGYNLHLCDIDRTIAELKEIKRIGAENFKNEYWGND